MYQGFVSAVNYTAQHFLRVVVACGLCGGLYGLITGLFDRSFGYLVMIVLVDTCVGIVTGIFAGLLAFYLNWRLLNHSLTHPTLKERILPNYLIVNQSNRLGRIVGRRNVALFGAVTTAGTTIINAVSNPNPIVALSGGGAIIMFLLAVAGFTNAQIARHKKDPTDSELNS